MSRYQWSAMLCYAMLCYAMGVLNSNPVSTLCRGGVNPTSNVWSVALKIGTLKKTSKFCSVPSVRTFTRQEVNTEWAKELQV